MFYRLRRSFSGPAITIAGLNIINDFTTFGGEPPAEILESDAVIVEDLIGNTWPGSFADAVTGGHMLRNRAEGRWPNAKLRDAEERYASKLAAGVA